MGRPIIKLERDGQTWFMEWTTVTDSPRTWGMSEAEFRDYYREEYGRSGSLDLDRRLDAAKRRGSSGYGGESVEDAVSHNRAGYDECTLTIDEIIEWYCVRKEEPPEGVGNGVHPWSVE